MIIQGDRDMDRINAIIDFMKARPYKTAAVVIAIASAGGSAPWWLSESIITTVLALLP